jgi:hypothetical protein
VIADSINCACAKVEKIYEQARITKITILGGKHKKLGDKGVIIF